MSVQKLIVISLNVSRVIPAPQIDFIQPQSLGEIHSFRRFCHRMKAKTSMCGIFAVYGYRTSVQEVFNLSRNVSRLIRLIPAPQIDFIQPHSLGEIHSFRRFCHRMKAKTSKCGIFAVYGYTMTVQEVFNISRNV